jgi:hypothetical protein
VSPAYPGTQVGGLSYVQAFLALAGPFLSRQGAESYIQQVKNVSDWFALDTHACGLLDTLVGTRAWLALTPSRGGVLVLFPSVVIEADHIGKPRSYRKLNASQRYAGSHSICPITFSALLTKKGQVFCAIAAFAHTRSGGN